MGQMYVLEMYCSEIFRPAYADHIPLHLALLKYVSLSNTHVSMPLVIHLNDRDSWAWAYNQNTFT